MKQVIVIRKDLKLPKGKMAVQAAHAAVESFRLTEKKHPKIAKEWVLEGMAKIVVYVENERALFALKESLPSDIPRAVITDAGRTVIAPGTVTCMGIGPYEEEELDRFTSELKLV